MIRLLTAWTQYGKSRIQFYDRRINLPFQALYHYIQSHDTAIAFTAIPDLGVNHIYKEVYHKARGYKIDTTKKAMNQIDTFGCTMDRDLLLTNIKQYVISALQQLNPTKR